MTAINRSHYERTWDLALTTVDVLTRQPGDVALKLIERHRRVNRNKSAVDFYKPVPSTAVDDLEPKCLGSVAGGLLSLGVGFCTRAT